MKVTYILPCVGRKPGEPYPRGWQMEPLSIGTLSAITPPQVERVFYDDRLEPIPYDEPTDLVAMSVETYTARRAYQIADRYRRRSVPVVLGGFHPTLVPDEASRHADAILIGEAETLWPEMLDDAAHGTLKPRYECTQRSIFDGRLPDRSIYQDKNYLKLSLVETARGCPHDCEFCSIAPFYSRTHVSRPVEAVVDELRSLNSPAVFFVDDNFAVDRARTVELLKALIPLKIRWAAQTGLDVAEDETVLDLMRRSGCAMTLIGFESFDADNLAAMRKHTNRGGLSYAEAIRRFRKHGISIYATFVFGYDNDRPSSFESAYRFVVQNRIFLAAFNHLVPFPGTNTYQRLKDEGRLLDDRWWLSDDYRFGDVAFTPKQMSPSQLADLCYAYRRKFYGWSSILRRGLDVRANCRDPFKTSIYWMGNVLSRREVSRRQSLPLGIREGTTE